MNRDWQEGTLGDLWTQHRDRFDPRTSRENLMYVGLKHIGRETLALIGHGWSSDTISHTFRFRKGDILFGKLRPYFRKVVQPRFDGVCSTDIWVIRAKPGVHQRFLFYRLASWDVINASSRADKGTKMPRADWDFLSRYKVYVPPYSEQRAIAHILGALDDKIELNRQMNETLEAMAQALFKSWFVDFEPVRAKAEGRPTELPDEIDAVFPDSFEDSEVGEIPSGWEAKSLDEIATYLNGLALQKYPPTGEDYLPVIKISEMRSGITPRSGKASPDTPEDYVVEDGDVLFSWSGSLEVVLWSGGRGALNQHLFKVFSESYPRWFYYFWTLEHLQDFRLIAEGKATTMGHIQRRHLCEAKVVDPGSALLELGMQHIGSLLNLIVEQNIQSRTLSAIRDALLPKLLSGDIRIPTSITGETDLEKNLTVY